LADISSDAGQECPLHYMFEKATSSIWEKWMCVT